MSGSNTICVSTVLLEKNIIEIKEPFTEFLLEAPGGLIPVKAFCKKQKVNYIEIKNLPSFVDKIDVTIKTPSYGKIRVSTVFGGDSFIICEAKDFNLNIKPENAKKFVEISNEIIKIANLELGFFHPLLPSLDFISFCQFIEPVTINKHNQKEGLSAVCIRPGKIDRSPCGTGTSARLALMREKKEINLDEVYISRSIIGSKFESFIAEEYMDNKKNIIIPSIRGSAFITGKQEIYISEKDPLPQGYRLNDTWPNKS